VVDFVSAVVADEQPFEVVEPGESAFDHPAHAAESGAVRGLAAGDERGDAALADEAAVLVVVVASIGHDALGAPTRPSAAAVHGWHGVQQRDQLGDVVAVAARYREGERDPGSVDEQMVLGSRSASVHRARARFGAPFLACTWLPSMTARDHSSSPACCKRSNSSACSLSHTPAACHSSSRRRQVAPEPKPSSSG
jgi:hypothetical protein